MKLNYLVCVFIAGGLSAVQSRAFAESKPTMQRKAEAAVRQGKPWLGVAIDKGPRGVLVKGVMSDTPAEQAGLKIDDQILTVDGVVVKEPRELIGIIQSAGIGQLVALEILRDGAKITKSLKLALRPDELKLLRDKLLDKPAPKFDFSVVPAKAHTAVVEPDTKGKVIVLEFWATWCMACRATHPELSEFAAKHPNVTVLAVSDEDANTVRSYAAKINPKFTVMRANSDKVFADWSVGGIPMIVVIDKSGIVRYVAVGAGPEAREALAFAAKL